MEKHLGYWTVGVLFAHHFLPLTLVQNSVMYLASIAFMAYVTRDMASDYRAAKLKRHKKGKGKKR